MPKVVHVLRKFVPAEWGGTETFILRVIPELARLGWLSEVHAPREAGTDGAALEAAGATFRTFPAHYPLLGLDAEHRAWLVATGGNLVSPEEGLQLARNRRASIFHTHALGRLGGVVRTAARLTRRPYAVTMHGPVRANTAQVDRDVARRTEGALDFGAPFGALVGARRGAEDADLVFVLNPEEKAAWEKDRAGRHLELARHGVDPTPAGAAAVAEARAAVPGLGDAPYLVVVGRLDPTKGQDLALAAFEAARVAGLHLVLVGSDADPAFAGNLRRSAGASPCVHLTGGVPPATARALLAGARLALIPSRAESFGLILLEAWAEGTPALFSAASGLEGISRATEAAAGRVASEDPAEWAGRIRGALADPGFLEAEHGAGPARVATRYTWRAVAENLAKRYEAALGGSAA